MARPRTLRRPPVHRRRRPNHGRHLRPLYRGLRPLDRPRPRSGADPPDRLASARKGPAERGGLGSSRRVKRSAVRASEKAQTLLSTSPCALAAVITSTSFTFAARPFRETTQRAPR